MQKYNYFEALESLALCAYEAVNIACNKSSSTPKKDFSEIRSACDKTLLALENALFSDFIPPLERDNIAAYAHCLSRVVDAAGEHIAFSASTRYSKRKNVEDICVALANELRESTAILRNLKKPGELPNIQKFRELLNSSFDTHSAELFKISSGSLPSSCATTALSLSRLRSELSLCFDKLLETMLNNI